MFCMAAHPVLDAMEDDLRIMLSLRVFLQSLHADALLAYVSMNSYFLGIVRMLVVELRELFPVKM